MDQEETQMKRGKKLIALLAALVILTGAALAATLLNPERQEGSGQEDLYFHPGLRQRDRALLDL